MLLAERAESDRLRQIIKELQRHRFGRRAESLPEDQLQLALEEAEQVEAAGHAETEEKTATERKARAAQRRANRGALPAHLISKRSLKVEAEANVAAARSAHGVLQKELLEASGRLQSREVAVERAAGAVLSSEAPPLIEDLQNARRTVWALEDKLKSLCTVRVAGADGTRALIQMPAETFAALHETAPPMLAYSVPKPYTIAQARWNKYLQNLTQDPDSSLD